jgi:hypothetical protein
VAKIGTYHSVANGKCVGVLMPMKTASMHLTFQPTQAFSPSWVLHHMGKTTIAQLGSLAKLRLKDRTSATKMALPLYQMVVSVVLQIKTQI